MSTNRFTVILLFIVNNCLSILFNQPKFNSCISWNANPITFADETLVGQQPSDIFINDNNTIYVTDRQNNRILMWYHGSLISNPIIFENVTNPWGLDTQKNESRMYINSSCTGFFIDIMNDFYCSSANEHRVFKVKLKVNMKMLEIIVAGTGCPGPIANMLDHPHGIFVDENLTLYVADTDNNRIQRFELNQRNAVTVAGFGAIDAVILNKPTGIILDGNNNLFIVDSQNHRIIRSKPNNGFECLFGCSCLNKASVNLLNNPQTMAFDREGNIFVTDFDNHRIAKFRIIINSCGSVGTCESSNSDKIRSGEILHSTQRLTSNNDCYYIEMQSDGNLVIYITPYMAQRIPIWSSSTYNTSPYKAFHLEMQDDGNLVIYDARKVAVWNSRTYQKGNAPYNLVMQNDGSLYIYDADNHCTWTSGTTH